MTVLSLRGRLLGAGAIAVLVALMLAAAGLAQLFGTHVERRAEAELSVYLDQVVAGLAADNGSLKLANAPADPRFSRPYGGLYWQIRARDQLLRSRSLWDTELTLPDDTLLDGEAHRHRMDGPEGSTLLALERSVALPPGLGGGRVRAVVALDAGDLAAAKRAFVTDMAPYLGLLVVVLIAAQWAQVTVGLSPLHTIGQRIARLRMDRAARMGSDWPSEVQPLAAELDELLGAREAEVDKARARAGDLAHGLKTPLQALLGEAGRLRQKGESTAADSIEEVATAMRAHVDRELARTRSAMRAATSRADAALVVQRVVAVLQKTPDGRRLRWDLDLPVGPMLAIDEADLAEALGALAENAARHGVLAVAISVAFADHQAVICITDDGPGLPPDRIAAMTQRGVRADQSGPGTGLGLSIAAEIADGAGGRLALQNTDTGLSACLHLPIAP